MEDEYEATLSAGMLYTWVNVSQLLWWLVLIFALLSQPILCHAFVTMLRHRNSNYFYFLTSMIVADLTMLSAVCINLVSDYFFPKLKGSVLRADLCFAHLFTHWSSQYHFVAEVLLFRLFVRGCELCLCSRVRVCLRKCICACVCLRFSMRLWFDTFDRSIKQYDHDHQVYIASEYPFHHRISAETPSL